MRPVRLASGFTLIEVLLATMLLAAALTLAFATLRAAGATAQRGEAMAARNERIRAVSEFLRRRIGGAQGIVFDLDQASGASRRFGGEMERMRFVSDLPDYLGRGGPRGDRRLPHEGVRFGRNGRDIIRTDGAARKEGDAGGGQKGGKTDRAHGTPAELR